MNNEMYKVMKDERGFIAALDQSGGSTPKALKGYGINEDEYSSEEEMFDLIHKMRARVITSPSFSSEHILGAILFRKTMLSKIEGKYTAEYLWENKHVVPFLKVDQGLAEEKNGVKLMKPITILADELKEANEHHVFGTKMRSVIYEANAEGIKEIVDQQFEFAKTICEAGLVPIIEPEVDIHSATKKEAEEILKAEVIKHLENWNKEDKVMFKFSIPTVENLYEDLYKYEAVVRIVALSGGYDVKEACEKLSKQHNMIASFSRALLQNLNAHQTDEEFNKVLNDAIVEIYNASID